jgi:hypothetical protein
MALPVGPELEARVVQLEAHFVQIEKVIQELHDRVVALERLIGAGGLHDYDQATVQKKASFDWQSPDRT